MAPSDGPTALSNMNSGSSSAVSSSLAAAKNTAALTKASAAAKEQSEIATATKNGYQDRDAALF